MRMLCSLVRVSILILAYGSWAMASDSITYKVVVNPPSAENVVGVAIGEDVFPLQPDPVVPMLYSGRGPSESSYRYVILNSTQVKDIADFEPFERPAIVQAEETFNEVYGRPWNKLELNEIPRLYEFIGDSKDPGDCKLFEEGTIATIHFTADDQQVQAMHANKMDKHFRVSGNLTYISYDHVQQFDNVELKVGGHSSRNWAKVPYKVEIPETSASGLYRRWDLKLRPESTDPTLLREKLYGDLLKAAGVLAPRGAYVRFYLNGIPVGLYLLVDDVASASYLRETIHQSNSATQLGSLIKGDAGKGEYAANFGYRGDNIALYDNRVYEVKLQQEGEPPAMESLIEFMKAIHNYIPSAAPVDSAALAVWLPKFDMQHYIRQMAVEWIGGNWDGTQYSGNNFVLYRHPTTRQYIVIPMDFDYTFGNGLEADQRNLMTGSWSEFTASRKIHSFLWEKVLATPYLRDLYERTLAHMNAKISNPDILVPRIEGLAYMIQKDVLWDRTLGRMTTGAVRNWPNDDYLQSLERGSGVEDELIGLKEWVRYKSQALRADVGTSANDYDDELFNEKQKKKKKTAHNHKKLSAAAGFAEPQQEKPTTVKRA